MKLLVEAVVHEKEVLQGIQDDLRWIDVLFSREEVQALSVTSMTLCSLVKWIVYVNHDRPTQMVVGENQLQV